MHANYTLLMRKIIFFILLFAAIILSGCAVSNPIACTEEAKICPDGTSVGRVPPDCDFEECPPSNSSCDFEKDAGKRYIGKSLDECSRIKFMCEQSSEYFSDECGCGCKLKEEAGQNYCTPGQRSADVCITLYEPVCGWFDPQKIQCIKYPCAQTFSNSCFACMDEKVLYWTEGECPK